MIKSYNIGQGHVTQVVKKKCEVLQHITNQGSQDSHDNLNILTFQILVVHNSMFNHISKILIERHAVKTRQVILLFIFYL